MRFLTEILAKAGITSNYFKLDTSATPPIEVGKVVWNAIDGTFDMGLLNNVTLQAGQELHFYGKAVGAISNGQAVMFAGAEGDHALMTLADAATINANPEYFIGVATQDFANNDFGYVTVLGKVRGLDTSAYTAGDLLYYNSTSATDGLLTSTMPSAPNAKILIAAVLRSHATEGVLLVRPHTMPKISDIQDVSISSLANNDFFVYESATSVWKNKTIAAALGYTPANDSNVVKLTGDQTVAGAKTFTSVINASTLSINGGTLVGNNIVSMRSNPTGGQFRIEKSDGSLSAYPFYVGVDGTALAYYYNASGALKVLLHTNDTSYFGNSLSVGYSTYATTSYMLDVNGTARFVGALTGTSATFTDTLSVVAPSSSTAIALRGRSGDNYSALRFQSNNGTTTYATIYSNGSDFHIENGGSAALTIASNRAATFSSSVATGGDVTISTGSIKMYSVQNVAGQYRYIGTEYAAGNGNNKAEIRFGIDGSDTRTKITLHTANGGGQINEVLGVFASGQFKLNNYTSSTSFSGTAAGYLAFDSSGNVITVAGVAATDNTKLPLAGGTLTGLLAFSNVTGNKIDFYHTTTGSGDRYGVQVQNSELRIHSGAGGDGSGGITFGKSTTTTFTEALRVRNDGIIQAVSYLRTAGVTSNTVLFNAGASSVDFGNAFGQGTTNRSVYFRGNTGVSAWWGGVDANGANIPFAAIDATAGEFSFWRNTAGTGGGTWTRVMTMNSSGLYMNEGTVSIGGNNVIHGGNIGSQSVNYASSAGSVAWSGVSAGTRTNYTLAFQPPVNDYAGFQFIGTNTTGAGYLLIRGSSDNDIYTAEGITLVADQGWLTLAQRTTAGKGIRFMTGVTAATRMEISNSGTVTIGGTQVVTNSGTWGINVTGSSAQVDRSLAGGSEANLIYAVIADNDFFRIRVGGGSNAGWAEIATADDGTEPIYVRQYTGVFSSVTRTATLLDGSGNTSFPGTVTAPTFSGALSGNASSSSYALRLDGYANQTIYTILDGPANGPVIKVRYDSATANRYIDFGSKDGNGVYYEGLKIYNGGTPTWQGNTILHSGNYNSYSPTLTGGNASGTWSISISGNAASVSGLIATQFFNNMGNNHAAYINANDVGGFGFRYLQGNTNGPNTGATQYYGVTVGLGNDYAWGTYASQFYWNRVSTGGSPYVSVRFQEGGSWGGWSKIYAGYADSAGTATTLSTNATITGLNFGGVFALTGSGANTGNSTGARLSESYGPVWNCGDGATWHHQVINGSSLVGISAGGTNYGSGRIYASGNITSTAGNLRSNNWVYTEGNAGWYNDTYGQGLRQVKGNVSYGQVIVHGENYNGWSGYNTNNSTITAFMQNSSGTHGFYQENNAGWTLFWNAGYACWGLGTDATDPAYSLHITKYGGSNTGWIIWSDRRIKENIKTIDGALDKILSLRGVYYNKIDDPNKERQVGYIAQEVLEVVPELVVYSEELDIYNMNYAPMVSMLTEATKEHYAKTLAQQAEIDALKEQVQTLLNHINNGV